MESKPMEAKHDPMWSLVLFSIGGRIANELQVRIPKTKWSITHDLSEDGTQVRFTWHGMAGKGQVAGQTTFLDLPKLDIAGQTALFESALKAARDSFANLAAFLEVVEVAKTPETKAAPASMPIVEQAKECLCGAFTGDNDACPQHGLNTAWRDLWG